MGVSGWEQRIPDPGEAEALEILHVGRGKFGDAVMAQGQCQPSIHDPANGKIRRSGHGPHGFYHRGRLDHRPVVIGSQRGAVGGCPRGVHGLAQDPRIPQLEVDLHQHEFADHHIPPPPERLEECGRRLLFWRASVGRVDHHVGVE